MNSSHLRSKLFILILFRIKLAQITNKCNDDDLDYYIKECSDILGITSKIENKNDPKAILSYVFQQLINFKKLNP